MIGDLVTVVGRHHLTTNEQVTGKQTFITLGAGADKVVITVPERFVNFPQPPAASVLSSTGEVTARDGTVRKSYYGAGYQPWDAIKARGWGATFAGGNILKYLRREKNADDLDKARWYWAELNKLADADVPSEKAWGAMVLVYLMQELTSDEVAKLIPLTDLPEIDPKLAR